MPLLMLHLSAMNMLKAALYRGCLSFLKEQWDSLAGWEIMQFDNRIILKFLSLQSFPVIGLGSAVHSSADMHIFQRIMHLSII